MEIYGNLLGEGEFYEEEDFIYFEQSSLIFWT